MFSQILQADGQSVPKKKKKRRIVDEVVDIGDGYDLDDPFVDNSEVVSGEQKTKTMWLQLAVFSKESCLQRPIILPRVCLLDIQSVWI